MQIALPEVIRSDDYDQRTRMRAESILSAISDPCLIARLLLIDKVYVQVEVMEKEAQEARFGSLDYSRTTSNLKVAFETILRAADHNALNVIKTGIFQHEFTAYRKKQSFSVNLRNSQNCPIRELESNDELQVKIEKVKEQYESWAICILNDFENYLEIPVVIDMAIQTFTLGVDIPLVDRVRTFRIFFSMVNTEFMPCDSSCTGLNSCSCVSEQLELFLQNVEMELRVTHSDPWTVGNSVLDGNCSRRQIRYNYSAIFAHYLAIGNEILSDKLKIVNVLRALEVVQLLKASQSATKRAFSIVGNVVKDRYELQKNVIHGNRDKIKPQQREIM